MGAFNLSLNGTQDVTITVPAPGPGRRIAVYGFGAALDNYSALTTSNLILNADIQGEFVRSSLTAGPVNINGIFIFGEDEEISLILNTDAAAATARIWLFGAVI